MAKNKVVDIAREVLQEFLAEQGMELYHLEYVKEGPDRVLRAYIDKVGGFISTEDCETVSRYLSDRLDELDPIESNYMLEVSSPGMDRTLFTEEHFKKYIGEVVEVSLYKEIRGSKKIEGVLKSYNNGDIELEIADGLDDSGSKKAEVKGEIQKFSKDEIAKVNLAVVI